MTKHYTTYGELWKTNELTMNFPLLNRDRFDWSAFVIYDSEFLVPSFRLREIALATLNQIRDERL